MAYDCSVLRRELSARRKSEAGSGSSGPGRRGRKDSDGRERRITEPRPSGSCAPARAFVPGVSQPTQCSPPPTTGTQHLAPFVCSRVAPQQHPPHRLGCPWGPYFYGLLFVPTLLRCFLDTQTQLSRLTQHSAATDYEEVEKVLSSSQ